MEAEKIFYSLLRAEQESEVDTILSEVNYLNDDESIWVPLGGYENNFSTVGNQHADATSALVDKIINDIDAVLMAGCFEYGISPQGPDAPKSMTAAIEQFFHIHRGRLDSIGATDRAALAERLELRLIAVGSKDDPCYLLVDKGEGQTPLMFPDTFLSLNKSNKMRIPFVQGKFNAGGTGVLQFCGEKNYQLIASRRHPKASVIKDDVTADQWGFTIVRRLLPSKGRRSSMYVYLAPDKKVLNFKAEAINVLPGNGGPNDPPKPYKRPLEYGTCIKLYNYRWKAKSIATTEARYELERHLHAPCLPIRVTETRKEYKANYYSTTVSGVWATIGNDEGSATTVEEGFPVPGELNISKTGPLPYRIAVFREEVASRHVPHGVFFSVNGQVHGRLPADFVRSRLKFDYLSGHLLVSVDCTNMIEQVREDFFMASRDRIRQNDVYDEVSQLLETELSRHTGLQALNAARRKKEIEKAIDSERNSVEIFKKLLRSDPSLAGLFSSGFQLVTSIGPGDPPVFKGKRFPTYFRLAKEPKSGLVKYCPINKTIHVQYETDACNDYFSRIESPGQITFEPVGVCQHWHLWNGMLSATFHPLANSQLGDDILVKVSVSDPDNDIKGGPFTSTFTMHIEAPVVREPGTDKTKKKKGQPNNGKDKAPRLAVPHINKISKTQWDSMDPPFTATDSLRVRPDGEGGYDFFLNVDNSYLLTELTRRKDVEKPLIEYWFTYGLTLCALGMLQELKPDDKLLSYNHTSNGNDDGSEKTNISPVDFVNQSTAGLARVIVPVIRSLYKGTGV